MSVRKPAATKARPHLKWRVLPNGRSRVARPAYASILPALAAAAAFRGLSGNAVRIWLLLQADYSPEHDTILPRDRAVRLLSASPKSVSAGFAELIATGIITMVRAPCRPGSMGGLTVGRATVFDLPERHGEMGGWKAPGDPSFQGYWRIDVGVLRQAVVKFSGPEIKLWTLLHARHRSSDGAPATNEPMPLAASVVARALTLSKATAARAIADLCKRNVIELATPASGRTAATFRLADTELRGASSRKMSSKAQLSPYPGETQTAVPRILVRRKAGCVS